MEAREAARTAVTQVKDLFSDEHLSNLGLEEVEFVPERNEWLITVGFSRPWDYPKRARRPTQMWNEILGGRYEPQPDRDYKVVFIDGNSGSVRAIKNREIREPVEV